MDRLSPADTELEAMEDLDTVSIDESSPGDRPVVVEGSSDSQDWMEFSSSMLSDDELTVIYSEPSDMETNQAPEISNAAETTAIPEASDPGEEARADDDIETAVTPANMLEVKLTDLITAEHPTRDANAATSSDEENTAEPPLEAEASPFSIRQPEPIPQFDLEEFLKASARRDRRDEMPERKQELKAEMHELRGQIDILELREEKLHLQMSNYVCEIDQLNEQNVLLENLVQDLPDIYRRKFRERMKPIRERIARIQEENIRLHEDIDCLAQKLAENALPPAENRRLIKLPSFGRRLPMLPNAVGQ